MFGAPPTAAAVGIRSSPSGTQHGYDRSLLSVTEVTFTPLLCSSSIQFVRGSSGGGLPRRPEQCSGRFFIYSHSLLLNRLLSRKHGPCDLLRPNASNIWCYDICDAQALKERGTMAANGIIEVTDANFDQDVLKSETPVLVDFWAAWGGPCRALAPIWDDLAKEYEGKVKIGKMDVDRNNATPMRYNVRGIPTLLLFKGGQVQEQIVGYVPKDQIQKRLEKHIEVKTV